MFSTSIFVLCAFTVVYTQQIPDEKWSYVNVRKNAFMFWWLYGAQTANADDRVSKPLVLWIQGGPGASGTGFGNFAELGPEDINGNKREYTWLKAANVLFVDNPVGAGFSYVTDDSAYTTNVTGMESGRCITNFWQLASTSASTAVYVHRSVFAGREGCLSPNCLLEQATVHKT